MPLVPSPPTWGLSVRMQCSGTPGQVAKATGFTFPKGTTVSMAGPVLPELAQRVRPRSCFFPEKGGISGLGPRLPAAAGLKQFPSISACLWTLASQALAETPAPHSVLQATWPTVLGPLPAPRAPAP